MQKSKRMPMVLTIGCCALVVLPGCAQIPIPRINIPGIISTGGNSQSTATDVNPDAFLAEAVQTTQMMMVAAAVLRGAANTDEGRDALRAEIQSIERASTPGELDALQSSFETNVQAASTRLSDLQSNQSRYNDLSAQQRQLLVSAAYNFAIGMARNVRLVRQGPELVRSLQSNPSNIRQVGSIRTAVSLLGQQASLIPSMTESVGTLLRRGGVELPTDSETTEVRSVDL